MEENQYLFIGTKEEVDCYKREIDYRYTKKIVQSEKSDEQYEHYYNNLSANSKKHVDSAIYTLTDNKEYSGYNLRQILKWFNESEKEFKISTLTEVITEPKKAEVINESYMDFIVENDKAGLAKKINELSKRANIKDINMIMLIKNICDNFLITEDLIYKGEGYIFTIDPNEYQTTDYMNFIDGMHETEYNTSIEFFIAYKEFLEDKYPENVSRTDIIKKTLCKNQKEWCILLT